MDHGNKQKMFGFFDGSSHMDGQRSIFLKAKKINDFLKKQIKSWVKLDHVQNTATIKNDLLECKANQKLSLSQTCP